MMWLATGLMFISFTAIFAVCITINRKQSFEIKPKFYFIPLYFLKQINEEGPYNVT